MKEKALHVILKLNNKIEELNGFGAKTANKRLANELEQKDKEIERLQKKCKQALKDAGYWAGKSQQQPVKGYGELLEWVEKEINTYMFRISEEEDDGGQGSEHWSILHQSKGVLESVKEKILSLSTTPQAGDKKTAGETGDENDLFKAIEKIKSGHYGSAINFIERYINTTLPTDSKEAVDTNRMNRKTSENINNP